MTASQPSGSFAYLRCVETGGGGFVGFATCNEGELLKPRSILTSLRRLLGWQSSWKLTGVVVRPRAGYVMRDGPASPRRLARVCRTDLRSMSRPVAVPHSLELAVYC